MTTITVAMRTTHTKLKCHAWDILLIFILSIKAFIITAHNGIPIDPYSDCCLYRHINLVIISNGGAEKYSCSMVDFSITVLRSTHDSHCKINFSLTCGIRFHMVVNFSLVHIDLQFIAFLTGPLLHLPCITRIKGMGRYMGGNLCINIVSNGWDFANKLLYYITWWNIGPLWSLVEVVSTSFGAPVATRRGSRKISAPRTWQRVHGRRCWDSEWRYIVLTDHPACTSS